jgi:hypothetical protein
MIPEEQIKTIIKYLETDLDDCNNLKKACFPIFMTVSSGIDFFGGLLLGFRDNNSGQRFKKFVTDYMGQVKTVYSNPEFAGYLYNYLRCKISHEACINGDLVTRNATDFEKKHLEYYIENNVHRIYIHPLLFKDNFIKAKNIFIEKFENDSTFKGEALQKYSARTEELVENIMRDRRNYSAFGLIGTNEFYHDGTNSPFIDITPLEDNSI